MSKSLQWALIVLVGVVALVAGALLSTRDRSAVPASHPNPASGAALLAATLPDLSGRPQRVDQWKGKVLVVNFWATWCAPCREEIPAFVKVQQRMAPKGVQMVGIAVDQPDKVKPYAAEMGINYPILIGELEAMDLARAAGNELGGLPYTVIVDRSGKVVNAQLGGITESKLDALVAPHL